MIEVYGSLKVNTTKVQNRETQQENHEHLEQCFEQVIDVRCRLCLDLEINSTLYLPSGLPLSLIREILSNPLETGSKDNSNSMGTTRSSKENNGPGIGNPCVGRRKF